MFKDSRENNSLLWRAEPICTVLKAQYGVKISTSGYYDHKKRPESTRRSRDEYLKGVILGIWESNYSCLGVNNIWHMLLNRGEKVARCTVERLMRELRIKGVSRGKVRRTTIAGKNAKSAEDLVRRDFWAPEPNRIWVADFT